MKLPLESADLFENRGNDRVRTDQHALLQFGQQTPIAQYRERPPIDRGSARLMPVAHRDHIKRSVIIPQSFDNKLDRCVLLLTIMHGDALMRTNTHRSPLRSRCQLISLHVLLAFRTVALSLSKKALEIPHTHPLNLNKEYRLTAEFSPSFAHVNFVYGA